MIITSIYSFLFFFCVCVSVCGYDDDFHYSLEPNWPKNSN
jgi:hypothetical protein